MNKILINETVLKVKDLALKRPMTFQLNKDSLALRESFCEIRKGYVPSKGKKFTDEELLNLILQHVDLQIEIIKKKSDKIDYYILVDGQGSINYTSSCIRCLEDVPLTLELNLNSVLINPTFLSENERDEIEYYVDSELRSLYLYDGQKIELNEFLYDFVSSNIQNYPLHDPNCKGLCQYCGVNKNLHECQCVDERKKFKTS